MSSFFRRNTVARARVNSRTALNASLVADRYTFLIRAWDPSDADARDRTGAVMGIELLTVCEWDGPHLNRIEVTHPTWQQVEDAIRALDGRTRNDLYLTPVASNLETYLTVGGGNGRYLVTGSINNERFPTAVRETKTDAAHESLVVGGQTGEYPATRILDLDSALSASRAFFETREFAGGGVTWHDV
jgi:hypothetical protein